MGLEPEKSYERSGGVRILRIYDKTGTLQTTQWDYTTPQGSTPRPRHLGGHGDGMFTQRTPATLKCQDLSKKSWMSFLFKGDGFETRP